MEQNGFLNTQERAQDNPGDYKFIGIVNHIPIIANLVKSIAFTSKVNVSVMERGIMFTVEEGKYIQASVTVLRDVFEKFTLSSTDLEINFKIPSKELLDCLKFFLSDSRSGESFSTAGATSSEVPISSLKVMYKSYGNPFMILLDENGVITDFQIKTEPFENEFMEMIMEDSVVAKLILTAEPMSDLLGEFEGSNPEHIRISIYPNKEIKMSCDGVAGFMTCVIPHNSDIVQGFECLVECHATYKFQVLRHTFKAMNMSQTMSIKIDSVGVLCLTFLMPAKTDSFVEFYILPNTLEDNFPTDELEIV